MAPYSDEEVEIIRQNYPTRGSVGVADLLPGRTPMAIATKAHSLGLKVDKDAARKPTSPFAWSEAELAILRRFYPTGGTIACAPRLPGRSVTAIQMKASLLGVRCTPETLAALRARVRSTQPVDLEDDPEDLVAGAMVHRRIPAGQWKVDHSTAVRSVFDLAGVV